MTEVESVSTGCFVFKSTRKSRRILKPGDYLRDEKETAFTTKSRMEIFEETWGNMKTEMEEIQANLNAEMFRDLLVFIKTSSKRLWSKTAMNMKTEIPTAALFTGVNLSDHSAMFSQCTQLIRDDITPHVAVLRSRDCGRLKTILSTSISQLTQAALGYETDEDENEGGMKSSKMTDLRTWYLDRYTTVSPRKKSPTKKRCSSQAPEQQPPLVIVFEDFVNFIPSVIQDFIIICSNYIDCLPFIMLFGISTTMDAIHTLLPMNVSSLLCIDKFSIPSSSQHLFHLIDRVLLTNEFLFKLDGRVFQLLLDIFLYHDFSVTNFTSAFKFACMHHFLTEPLSLLCRPLQANAVTIDSFTAKDVTMLRDIPAINRALESECKEEQEIILTDTKRMKCFLLSKLHDLDDYHKTYYPALRVLHTLTCNLPKYPLGRKIREVYALSLECDATSSSEYKEAFALLHVLAADQLVETITSLTTTLCSDQLAPIVELLQYLSTALCDLADIDKVVTETSDSPVLLPKKTNLHTLRQTLSEIHKKRTKTPYENLRQEILDRLHDFFVEYLRRPQSLPLSEVYYYGNLSVIKQRFYASPRSSIQVALSNPHHYLQCRCCKTEPGAIRPAMPDTCILYKLHLECGRYINLYDWLQAFNMIVTEDNEDGGSVSDVIEARFIQGVSVLQFLGFIKSTKRKTDHVARLTWGGC